MSNLSAGERLLMEKYFGCFSQNDQVKHQIANCARRLRSYNSFLNFKCSIKVGMYFVKPQEKKT